MSFGLRLSLLLLIAGCAEQALVVADTDWRTVPAAQRDAIDRKYEADLAAARAELAAATASLAALPKPQPAPPTAAPRPSAPAAGEDDDPWNTAMHDHARARIDARSRVDVAQFEVSRTDALWRQARVDTAQARFEVLVAEREVIRAHAVNRALPGDETYDSAPVRGQFSRAQQRWYAVASRGRTARDAFERASRNLASAKEAYAQLMRHGPARMPELPTAPEEHTARYELLEWSVQRGDIRRRRGRQHFLDEVVTAPPTLRKMTYQPSRAVRTSLPAVAAAPLAAAPGGTADHPADPATDKAAAPAPAVAAKPAAAPPPTTGKPAAAPPPTSTVAAKPAAAPPPADHPADRAIAENPAAPAPSPASAAARPATAAARPAAGTAGSPADHPADHAIAAKPAAAPSTTARAAGAAGPARPAAPSTAVAAKPVAAPAAKPAAPASGAAPSPAADHPADRAAAASPAPPAAKPAARPSPPAGAPSAAKPVERPLPDGDGRTR